VAKALVDYIGQVAGLLIIGGEMDPAKKVSKYVPTYILNGTDTMVERYREVNRTNAYAMKDGVETFYDESIQLHKVMVAKDDKADLAKYVQNAFDNIFAISQRVYVIRSTTEESTLVPKYQSYVKTPDISHYALCSRNAIVNGVTVKGNLQVSFHQEEIFSDIKTMYDQYLQSWYEVLPKSVVDGTAPAGSVPLILALHGTGDDPLMFIDEIGWLNVAGKENLAVVAPFEEELVISHEGGKVVMGSKIYEGILAEVFPIFLKHLLEKYPALDPTRVYASGYSLGGGSVYRAIYGGMDMIAAAVPMAGMHDDMFYNSTEEQDAKLKAIGIPLMEITSTFDLGYNQQENRLTDNTLKIFRKYAELNGITLADTYDFNAYPMIGFKTDEMNVTTINGEWRSFLWTIKNKDGVPMMKMSCTENLTHSLYPNYSEIAWKFMKNFSRDPKTGGIVYALTAK
jgi:poly(3-hydroxybutyrate) depolymerase